MITNFFHWVRETFSAPYQDEIYQYLSSSTDLCDLERRMTHLSRGGWIV